MRAKERIEVINREADQPGRSPGRDATGVNRRADHLDEGR